MDYVTAGSTGVKVSQLCFGTMSFGDIADEQEFGAHVPALPRRGHQLLRLRQRLRRWPLRGNPRRPDRRLPRRRGDHVEGRLSSGRRRREPQQGASRRHIHLQVEASLKRLKTDRIHVYFIHPLRPATRRLRKPCARSTIWCMTARFPDPALSNWSAWQIAKALGISAYEGLARVRAASSRCTACQAPGRGRNPAAGAGRGDRRNPLQSAGRRPAHGQVRFGRSAAGAGAFPRATRCTSRATASRSFTRSRLEVRGLRC